MQQSGLSPCALASRLSALLLSLPVLAGALLAGPDEACAQNLLPGQRIRPDIELQRGMTILDRRRNRVEPQGVRAGSFLILPSLMLDETFDSNIFRTDGNKENDFITTISPEIRVRSTWSNHELGFRAGLDQGIYADHDSETYTDYGAGVRGRLDILRDLNLFGRFDFDNLHEERGSPDDVAGEDPTDYSRMDAAAGLRTRFNRLTLTTGLSFTAYDFDDVAAGDLGTINNDDRDHRILGATVRADYELVPRFGAFLEARYDTIDYDQDKDDFGLNRDGDHWQILVGTDIDFTGITFGQIALGYENRSYDDEDLDGIHGISARADIFSNITTLVTLNIFAERVINETTTAGSSGVQTTSVGLSVDYELLRSLLIQTDFIYYINDYEDIDRDDHNIRWSLSADYQINRFAFAYIGYDISRRNSTLDADNFVANELSIGVRLQY